MLDLATLVPRLVALAEADPDREVCGFVVEGPGGDAHVHPVRNVAGVPREGFEVDPAAHLALARRLRREGGRIVAVYHSHLDGPARLSATDLEHALADGAPVLPGVEQIVIGMSNRKVQEVRAFRFVDPAFEPLTEWSAASPRRVAPTAR